jgi:putative transposase
MPRKKYTTEQIIQHLRTIEIESGKGMTIEDAVRKHGIPIQSYYRWKKEYAGMDLSQAKKLKELEIENQRLKKLVADLSIDNQILKEVSKGNF